MMMGAFAGWNVGEMFPVVSAVTNLVCEDKKAYAAVPMRHCMIQIQHRQNLFLVSASGIT